MERCSLQCLEGMLGEQGLRQKEKTGLEQGPPTPWGVAARAWEGEVCACPTARGCRSRNVGGRPPMYAGKRLAERALPGCHRNEKEVGGGRRRRGAGEGGGAGGGRGRRRPWGRGAGFCSSGAAAFPSSERWREPKRTELLARAPGPLPARHHGEGGGQPAPPALAWPSGDSALLRAPGWVPRRAQVGIPVGTARRGCTESGAPGLSCLPTGSTWWQAQGPKGPGPVDLVGSSLHPERPSSEPGASPSGGLCPC